MLDKPTTRRQALGYAAGGLAAAGLGRLAGPLTAARADTVTLSRGRTKVVILGSQGGQNITQITGSKDRAGTSVLIDVDGVVSVVDCGIGSAHRLSEAGYNMNAVRNIFVTHCHADHIADLAAFATLAWSSGRNGLDQKRRLDIYGPTGIKAFERGMKEAFKISIDDQEGPLGQVPTFRKYAHWHEMEPPRRKTKVVSNDLIDVRAIRVRHGGVPAVAYRIATPDLDIVFTGDRGYGHDAFPGFAKDADILFHEIFAKDIVVPILEAQGQAPGFIDHLVKDHCDPQQVGKLATGAGVPNLVLYHLTPGNPGITDDNWKGMVAPYYAGNVIVARDLMEI